MQRYALPLAFLTACGAAPEASPTASASICSAPEFSPGDWDRSGSKFVVALGDPVHAADDAVVRVGVRADLEGKFAYGPTSKDLQSETVRVAVRRADDCDWFAVGDAVTDSDGRARIAVHGEHFDREGRYEVRWSVAGDASEVTSWVYAVAPRQPAVVFDIDGTLTTSDLEAIDGVILHTVGSTSETLVDLAGQPLTKEQWMWGLEQVLDEDADMYEGADDVVRHYAELGYQPVFITGRPYLFQAISRRWLARRNFPAGPLFHVQDLGDALPDHVTDYKAARIRALEAAGLDVDIAYGNASTDICAYRRAGIDEANTFIIGKNAGDACDDAGPRTVAVDDYPTHLDALRAD